MYACTHVLEAVQQATGDSKGSGPATAQAEPPSSWLEDPQCVCMHVSVPAAAVGLWPCELICPQV